MPSPVDRPRLELLLRVVAFAGLLWLTEEAVARRLVRSSGELTAPLSETLLAGWAVAPPADTLSVRLDAAPSPLIRDWLVALRRTGTGIRWSDGGVAPFMIEAERRPDPAGGVMLRVTGPAGASVRLTDDLGVRDSFTLGALGASVRLASVAGAVRAAVGTRERGAIAVSTPPPIGERRHLVLLGAAGWEAKFVAAALEERGWEVDARLIVAPGLAVTQGRPFPLDTARHAAVIALDTTAAANAAAIVNFVRHGGGVLLGPDAAKIAPLRALAPGRGGVILRPSLRSGGPVSRELLGLHDLAPLVAGAYPLELRGVHVAVAVRRLGAGRIGQVGYAETWRWRMEGTSEGLSAHRYWWAAVVASVAYGGEAVMDGDTDPAPRAALLDALGEPSLPAPYTPPIAPPIVLGVLILCLLGEWTSRRSRGAR